MVLPSVTETTLVGQEKQVAGMARGRRKVRREQRMLISLDWMVVLSCLPHEKQEINLGKNTYFAVINKQYHHIIWIPFASPHGDLVGLRYEVLLFWIVQPLAQLFTRTEIDHLPLGDGHRLSCLWISSSTR